MMVLTIDTVAVFAWAGWVQRDGSSGHAERGDEHDSGEDEARESHDSLVHPPPTRWSTHWREREARRPLFEERFGGEGSRWLTPPSTTLGLNSYPARPNGPQTQHTGHTKSRRTLTQHASPHKALRLRC